MIGVYAFNGRTKKYAFKKAGTSNREIGLVPAFFCLRQVDKALKAQSALQAITTRSLYFRHNHLRTTHCQESLFRLQTSTLSA